MVVEVIEVRVQASAFPHRSRWSLEGCKCQGVKSANSNKGCMSRLFLLRRVSSLALTCLSTFHHINYEKLAPAFGASDVGTISTYRHQEAPT